MRTVRGTLAAVVAAGLAWASGSALAVDGVVEINQARALKGGVTPGDAAGFPVTISAAGSYRLTSNLTVPDVNTDGIDVTTDNVSIDLNGFAILGPVTCSGAPVSSCSAYGTGYGIRGDSAGAVTVENGRVQGFGAYAISLGKGARVSGVRARWSASGGFLVGNESAVTGSFVTANGLTGIVAGDGGVVSGNIVRGNQSTGVSAGGTTTVTANTVSLNGLYGIVLTTPGGGSTIVGNAVSGNSATGIFCATAGGLDGYSQNVLKGNNGGGPQVSGCTQLGTATNICNGVACP